MAMAAAIGRTRPRGKRLKGRQQQKKMAMVHRVDVVVVWWSYI